MPDNSGTVAAPVGTPTPVLPKVAVDDSAAKQDASVVTPVEPATVADSAVKLTTIADSVAKPVIDPVVSPAIDPVVTPVVSGGTKEIDKNRMVEDKDIPLEVAKKIGEAHNVLIALSSDPSVDEMAAAIGLSLYLDRLGKRATAIYSGQTPNALEFLKPEETFEPTVDTLQDFVIALNKDKADHLRYKLDGDFVKIYITPYKSRVSEEDLDFSYGDFNVDLVLALNVANGTDLDTALREHGRIMHDAVIVNITTGNPGKLGEIEWSNKTASSVSEMIAKLLYSANSRVKIEKEEATAFLTGIVAATDRFSNAKTTPQTMEVASRLMQSGANQQLVSKNITPDIENQMLGMMGSVGSLVSESEKVKDKDPTNLDIIHDATSGAEDSGNAGVASASSDAGALGNAGVASASSDAGASSDVGVSSGAVTSSNVGGASDVSGADDATSMTEAKKVDDGVMGKNTDLLDDLKAAEASLAMTGAEAVPETKKDPLEIDSAKVETPQEVSNEVGGMSAEDIKADDSVNMENPSNDFISDKPEKVLQPEGDFSSAALGGETDKYGKMLEDALGEANESNRVMGGIENSVGSVGGSEAINSVDNPAAMGAPSVPVNPEINGVPEINYMPMPGDTVLPPPPTPPIDMSTPMTVDPAASTTSVVGAPSSVTGTDTGVTGSAIPGTAMGMANYANPGVVGGATLPPVAPTMPVAQAAPAAPTVEPAGAIPTAEPASDPSAFKIPGT